MAILDEPTAALDPIAEYEIYKSFNKLTNDKTCIYISHRMSSSYFCDKIAVFDKGLITEYGHHDNLIKNNKIYADMYHKQSQYYLELKDC